MPKETISRRTFAKQALSFAAAAGSLESREALASHNWMLVGTEHAFLSHLPMFDRLNKQRTDYDTPHRFQVIAKAAFETDGADQTALYFAERQNHPSEKMFTVQPDGLFVLPQLATGPLPTSFAGAVFRGHLERGGQPIPKLQGVSVKIAKIVHFHKFDPKAAQPAALEYILFGEGTDLFLAHLIVKPPSFDQILSIKLLDAEALRPPLQTAPIVRALSRANTPLDRIKEDERLAIQLPNGGPSLQIQALREFYFEEGELLMPATFDQTPAELKAGF